MKSLLCINLLMFLCSTLFSQKIIGNWEGNIDAGGRKLLIVFHFNKDNAGNVTGNWESPNEKAMGLPFSNIKVKDDSVLLEIKMINGSYDGKFMNNDSIEGIWEQNGSRAPLNFSREKPEPRYPGEKDISIISAGGSRLYGTLLSKNNHQKIAIIVAGSGPTDRNGNSSLGVKTNAYRMLAYALDSQNIATFRYDKRGVAKSIPADFNESDFVFDDYVKDFEKIFDYLYDTLGFKNIYFIGHSEGSLISMLASQKKKVKGFISIAGLGRPIDVVLDEQLRKQPFPDSIKQQIPQILDQLKQGKEVNNIPEMLAPLFRKSTQPYLISWMKYSPQNEIKKLNCPILILQGGCDIQVKEIDANNLHNANNKSTLDIITTMSHTLKNAGNDCVSEGKTYSDGSMQIDKVLVKDIEKFIED